MPGSCSDVMSPYYRKTFCSILATMVNPPVSVARLGWSNGEYQRLMLFLGPEDFEKIALWSDSWFGKALAEQHKQLKEGRLPTLASVRNDAPFVTGKASLTLKKWISENRDKLLGVIRGTQIKDFRRSRSST